MNPKNDLAKIIRRFILKGDNMCFWIEEMNDDHFKISPPGACTDEEKIFDGVDAALDYLRNKFRPKSKKENETQS